MPESVQGDRIVVTGRSDACFFPRIERETSFVREFDGRGPDGAFDLRGSIYGRKLQFRGSGECRGAVVGRGDLVVDVCRDGERQKFLGALTASGGIDVRTPSLPIRDTVSGHVRNASVIIRGDAVGDSVSLRNAVVVGNVHGTNIQLTNCVVLGAAVAAEQLTIQASSLLYYHCRSVSFEGPCLMLHAMGESATAPVFAPWEDPSGEVFPSDIRYYPPIRGQEGGDLGNRPWKRPAGATLSRLYPKADWVQVDTYPVEQGGKSAPRTALTIAGRAMNLVALQVATAQMVTMLRIGFEFDHYTPRSQKEALAKIASLATEEEQWVFSSVLEPKDA